MSADVARCWSWGGGWDSSAGIIRDIKAGRRIDLITMADHGSEKRFPDRDNGEEVGTYEFMEVFSDYVERAGYPRPVICRYQPKLETSERYLDGVRTVVRELGLEAELTEVDVARLSGIYGNAVANETLPGISFTVKSCSIKWKLEAQEPI